MTEATLKLHAVQQEPATPRWQPKVLSSPISVKDLILSLRDQDIERVMQGAARQIDRDAATLGVPVRTLATQVRLHLPRLTREALQTRAPKAAYERVRLQAISRVCAAKSMTDYAENLAHASLLIGQSKVRRDLTITLDDGYTLPITLESVRPTIGHLIQSRLHYLQSARCDTSLQLGFYLPEARFPLTYVAFSVCDRPYMRDALAFRDPAVAQEEILVLTRMFGLPNTPPNMLSLLISRAIRFIKLLMPVKYIVTACNPMLGFLGTSFLAAGFAPFATAPVTYSYCERGLFTTRRLADGPHRQTRDTPPNLLLALGAYHGANKRLASSQYIVPVAPDVYEDVKLVPQVTASLPDREELRRYRQLLESAWSVNTAHPRYALDAGRSSMPNPRGQCGVTSAWLAVELHGRHNLDATYCYGSLEIDIPGVPAVRHHCWLEIGEPENPHRLVIDLTSDQAVGLNRDIICEPHDELVAQGMRYVASTRLPHDRLPSDPVWSRLEALLDVVGQHV